MLTLFDSAGGVVATNDNWELSSGGLNQAAFVTATDSLVGAFPLPAGSADTALLATVHGGIYTAGLLSPNGSSGIGLIEIYDNGGNPDASLVNVSARMNVSAGDGSLIAGLVIAGGSPKTVLIRGVGPTLASFGVAGVLSDPLVTVFWNGTQIASNSGWATGNSTPAQITSAEQQVGAFPLMSGSQDAALLLTLQPGAYTIEVTSISGASGVALVEVYDMQ
jgi:hypothetical protein